MRKQLRHQFEWRLTLISCLILPIIPALGLVGIIIVLLITAKQKYQQIKNNYLNWLIGLLSIGLMINSCFAFHPQSAWLGLANLLPFLAIVAVYSQIFVHISQLRQLAWVLIVPVIPIVILGWLQLLWEIQLPNLLGWELVAGGNPSGRMASVFMYANILAVYLLIVFCLNLGLWLETYQSQKHSNKSWQLPYLSLCLLMEISGLILTSSRNAWGIALLISTVVIFYLGWRWLVWLGMSILSIILWAAFGPNPGRQFFRNYVPEYIWARLSDEMYSDRPRETLRLTQWEFSWDLVQQRPWLGWGLRNFTILYQDKMDIWLGHPHNLFLMLMAEIGIPLTLILSLIVGIILASAIFTLKHLQSGRTIVLSYLIAFIACTLFNLFDVSLFDLRVNLLTWLLLSAINGIHSGDRTFPNPSV